MGSNNDLLQHQAITWTNELLSVGPLGTHFSKSLVKTQHLKKKKNAFVNVIC